jgi:hypothetical protein
VRGERSVDSISFFLHDAILCYLHQSRPWNSIPRSKENVSMDANVFDLRRCLVIVGLSLAGALSCAAQQAKPAPAPPAKLCEPPSRAGRTDRGVGSGSGAAATGDEVRAVFSQSDVTKKAEVLFRPEPDYPASEPGRWEVKLRVVLCPRGYVSGIEVLSKTTGDAAEKAVEAAREIRFIPAEKDGKRVAQYATIIYSHEVY